jgi:hypothetical protein
MNKNSSLNELDFSSEGGATKPSCNTDETIFDREAELRKPHVLNSPAQETADGAAEHRRKQMRSLSLMLATVFPLAGATLADPSESGLPGIGTFAYGGPHGRAEASSVIVAAR